MTASKIQMDQIRSTSATVTGENIRAGSQKKSSLSPAEGLQGASPDATCTCPSGGGSLRHPCPAHPAVEQAGGDERDFQAEGAQEVPSPVSQEYDRHLISLLRKGEALPGHQEEAADEIERLRDWNDHLNNTVLPNILNPNFLMLMKGGERLLDLCTKDGKFIGVSLNDMKDVFDWMVTHARIAPDHAALAQPSPASDLDPLNLAPHAEAFNEAPAEALKPEPAEADRPEVVARVVHSNPVVLGQCGPLNANDELMTVAQHAASVARWAEMFNRVEQQRDAALARVAEMERQEPVATVAKVPGEDWNSLDFHRDLQHMQPGTKLYAAPVAQAQQLNDLDKQCRDDVARALGLRPNQERGFAWSYLLASIKSCVKVSGDSAQAQHSGPDGAADLCRFLAKLYCELDGLRYSTAKLPAEQIADALIFKWPVLQGARNQLNIKRISEQPYDESKLHSAIAAMLAAAPGKEVPQAWLDVQAERRRQITAEGWTPEHDDLYCAAELPRAAAAYILNGANDEAPAIWPFVAKWWKPRDARSNYVRAGALILAEIERLDRAAPGKEVGHE
ncbi:hypothetical protein [Pseudomonas aeruginosa]|uniref:hypothetical protein n=1 Tax=Pseudomonas aeruginosa TaxID=287 RepID=UPI000B188F7E|nr:hypothetical protein [Pseudomonas aeruginosa]